jgi:hypothetical protein
VRACAQAQNHGGADLHFVTKGRLGAPFWSLAICAGMTAARLNIFSGADFSQLRLAEPRKERAAEQQSR